MLFCGILLFSIFNICKTGLRGSLNSVNTQKDNSTVNVSNLHNKILLWKWTAQFYFKELILCTQLKQKENENMYSITKESSFWEFPSELKSLLRLLSLWVTVGLTCGIEWIIGDFDYSFAIKLSENSREAASVPVVSHSSAIVAFPS